ncbi:DNA-directed RNA polymerase I largest subunit [Strigomonas culicis]|uniref:DNA-directed RNA polymerase n=1 Tax=Strigomonas culicis TaxID=28005 RepID=S9TG59_9TRYP|nr:DNA-directed RNA polymerase I largest subunit [Strigomonas culicis]|eukprot:EPY15934.1 DNA-directed RNA polymerase I largest subunit [Strigomonas culicis]
MQENHIVVLSDTIDRALQRTALPSWLPRFRSIHFTRSATDPRSGELIFQGSARDAKTSIRDVVNYLSYFTTYTCAHAYGEGSANSTSGILIHKATSTDIQDVCQNFGIEGGYASLLTELHHLFKRYAVDERHLSLIADTAMHRGRWENFNFTGVISRSASPLFQMTFASAKRFIHAAVASGLPDTLQSVSAAVMVGAAPQVGTACAAAQLQPELLGDVVERWF